MNLPFKAHLTGLQALLLAGLMLGQAGAVTATPGSTPARAIRPAGVSGFNLGNWMPVVEAVDTLRALQPATLRWPGGNVGDDQDPTLSAMHTLKVNWTLLGQPPLFVQTRVFKGAQGGRNTPADAAQQVRDARTLGLKVTAWEIGNEPDLYSRNRGDASWTPEKYCAALRAQRAAIQAVDPQAVIAGPASSQPNAYLEDVIRLCGDALDIVSWHIYPTNGDGTPEDALHTVSRVTDSVERIKTVWNDQALNPLGHQRPLHMAVTEYALSWRSDRARFLSDEIGGLWAAEATLRLAEAGVEFVHYFSLMSTQNHGLVDQDGFPRPGYAAFGELTHFRGQTFSVRSDDPQVWIHGAQEGQLVSLFVINTKSQDTTFTLGLGGYRLIGAKTVTDKDVEAGNFPRALRLTPDLILPPLSLTRIVLKSTQ